MNDIDNLILRIKKGIDKNKNFVYFLPYIRKLSQKTKFIGSKLNNIYMYRIRRENGSLFTHTDKLKAPPPQYTNKGRLNEKGESITYMSLGELAPIAELDIRYYEIFCLVKIHYIKRKLLFHYAGIKGNYESNVPEVIKVNEFYRDILRKKDKKYYNATIALAKHFMDEIKTTDGSCIPSGLIYTSVHDDKSNKNLLNVAVRSEIFDDYFKIIDAKYKLIAYDIDKESNIIHHINEASIDNEGNIIWKWSYEEMMDVFSQKFNSHVYFINNENGDDFIIHYKYGGGIVTGSDKVSYSVNFPLGNRKVMIEEINAT